MSLDERYVGDTTILSTIITDAVSGANADPTDLVLTIFHKESATTTTIPKVSLTTTGLGLWKYEFNPPSSGTYIYRFQGTGANKGVDYEAFTVKKNPMTGV